MEKRRIFGFIPLEKSCPKVTGALASRKRSLTGFTVIELLIAVGIVIVLAAVILFFVNRSRAKAEDARTQETLSSVRTIAVEERLGSESGTSYAAICSSDKVRDTIQGLAEQLQTIDYACVSSDDSFVVAFPLKAREGYWCVDSNGAAGQVTGLPTVSPPHSCDHVAPSDGTGGPVDDGGSGGSGGSGGDDDPDGSGGGGAGGDGDDDPEGEEDEEGSNQAPSIQFNAGSIASSDGTQSCAGVYCVVFPDTTDADLLAFVSATDPEDGALSVEVSDEHPVYTSGIPTSGPGPNQKTIVGIGTFENCNVSSREVVYSATDSEGTIDTATRTILSCNEPTVPDTTAPTVSITAPSAGATLSDTVAVAGIASDNIGVVGVSFFYGPSAQTATTQIATEDTLSPYAVSWDTTEIENGTYVLVATTHDVTGNTATSLPVTVTIDNEVVPVGPPARKPLLFSSGFEGTSSTFLNGFDPDENQFCCSYSVTQATGVFREGLASMRAEVRGTDPKVSGGWRAEIQLPEAVEDTGDRWYGWSVYFASPQSGGLWTGVWGGLYGYWNPANNAGPAKLAFAWDDNLWDLVISPDFNEFHHYGPTPSSTPIPITSNTWHDVVVHANWTTGLLEVWIDASLFYSAPAGGGSIDEVPGQYLKLGMAKYGNGSGGRPTDTWIMYYDSVRVGDGATGVGYYDVAPGDY